MQQQKQIHTFSGGMVKDIADTAKKPNTYEDALDVRLNSNDGASDHILVNVKGTELSFSVPDTPYIATIYNEGNISNSWNFDPQLLFSNGSTSQIGANISGSGTLDDLFNDIEESLRNDPVFAQYDLNVHRVGSRIRIWSDSAEIVGLNVLPSGVVQSFQAPQIDQQIIGWDRINDTIYLFTTNDTSQTGGVGSIYSLMLDQVTLDSTITLLYSEELNFTTFQPIANPGGIVSIFETPDVSRIYWTDRHNDLRTINIADPNVMATRVDDLSLRVSVQMRKPVLASIQDSGALLTGHYQIAYALRTEGGAITPFSHTSNSIFIADADVNGSYSLYRGNDSGVVTSKSFTVRIQDIDTNFAFMDIIVLRKEDEDSTAFIEKVAEIPITSNTMSYTHTGRETASILTENQFNRVNNMFDRCHTIAEKDNILFAANTERDPVDIQFDARAYRWNFAPLLVLNDLSGNSQSYTTSDALDPNFLIPEDEDAINPDQTIYKYQSDGVTLGGEGPNISYRFTTEGFNADVRASNDFAFPWRIPWRSGGGNTFNLGDDVIHYEGPAVSGDADSPYRNHIFRGYRRGETYRFAWVPFKDGKEGFARWIADIRMPEIFEGYTSGSPWYGNGDTFPLLYPDFTVGSWNTQQLGVEFTVNIPSDVADKIDGYRIKRVKLEPEDRTVLAKGFIHLSRKFSIPDYYTPVADNGGSTTSTYFGLNGNGSDIWNGNDSHRIVSFHSPDFLFGKGLDHRTGDRIEIISGISEQVTHLGFNPSTRNKWYKLYNEVPLPSVLSGNTSFDVRDGRNVGLGQTAIIDGLEYRNHTQENNGNIYSFGTDTTVLALDRGLPQIDDANIASSGIGFTNLRQSASGHQSSVGNGDIPDKMYAKYVRDTVASQYGGQSYESRSRNAYINTGIEVMVDSGSQTNTLRVFGGDTFVNIFDTLKMVRNFQINPNGATRATGIYYPTESYVNTDLREGFTCQNDYGTAGYLYAGSGVPDPAQHELDYGEDFKYNYLFSEQMDTQRSFPLPINFSEVTEHPVRIWASGEKVYGEKSDAWRIFDNEKYIDISGNLGEIRQLVNNNEQLIAWQKHGLGVASVNERAVVNDNSGSGIVLGKSGILPRFDYLSQKIGAWHQFSFSQSADKVLFFDMKDGGIYTYDGKTIKDITEGKMKGWLYENTRGQILVTDNPVYEGVYRAGVCSTYDNRNKEFLITFHDADRVGNTILYDPNSFTLAYHDRSDRFISFRSHRPTMYINTNQNVLSPSPDNNRDTYLHDVGDRCVFYGNDPTVSQVTIVVNGSTTYSKVFDNIEWHSEVFDSNGTEFTDETVSGIEIYNPYQTTGLKTVFEKLLREWKHSITYELGTKNRIRNHYAKERFEFQNNDNKEFKLHYITNIFRVFPK